MSIRKYIIRKAIWDNVIQSIQIGLGIFQATTMIGRGADVEELEVSPWVNAISGVLQFMLGVAGIWTKDANNDGIIDIAQVPDEPKITHVTTTIEEVPGKPAKISVEETKE